MYFYVFSIELYIVYKFHGSRIICTYYPYAKNIRNIPSYYL